MNVLERLRDLFGLRGRDAPPQTSGTDFAEEHSRPTYADEPPPEGPDESVPHDRGGAGGLDRDGRG